MKPTILFRNCEMTCLQAKHFVFDAHLTSEHQNQIPFFAVNLRNRKNWQKKMKSNGGLLNGQFIGLQQSITYLCPGNKYEVYEQPKTLAICMYTHVNAWIQYLQTYILCWPLQDEDYIFPTMSANGQNVYPHKPVSKEDVQSWLDEFSAYQGLDSKYRYTTHCFHCGGAQYRFMYALIGDRWTLARIRWWGGWAQGEHVSTANNP